MKFLTLLLITGLTAAAAQVPHAHEFAVASVKPDESGNNKGEGSESEKITVSPDGLIMWNVSLRSCISWAYDVRDSQISGPGWLASTRYDIAAKASGPAPIEDLKLMMRTLLGDRLKVQLRRESKELPVYAMLPGRKGMKFQQASGGDSSMLPTGGALVFRNYSIPDFAERLNTRPFRLDRPVVDRTGLHGLFDFTIAFADNLSSLKQTLESMDRGSDESPSMITILQEQLGVTFKAEKASVDSLVVEHAEKVPAAN